MDSHAQEYADTYRYVEFCRDLHDRNHLYPVSEYKALFRESVRLHPGTPYFRSMFLYPRAAVEHIKTSGSLAGYAGSVWADYVTIDIDDGDL